MKRTLFLLITLFLTAAQASTPIRIGWQVPWAVQGQLVAIFKNTDILKNNNISASFIGKNFGPELNELALANELDIVFTADQPAAALFSKDKGWVGISRLMYNRTATYVPLNSKIANVQSLKGKKVGVPFGAAAQRIIYNALEQEKLKATDVQFINLGILEQDSLIKKSNSESTQWDQFDALAGFDPLPAKLEYAKQVKIIHEGKVVALILMNENLIKKDSQLPYNLNKALVQAYEFYRTHLEKVNKWYIEDSKLTNLNDSIFKITAKFEPNLDSKNKVSIDFSSSDFEILDQASTFVEKSTGKKVDMKKYVTNKYTQFDVQNK